MIVLLAEIQPTVGSLHGAARSFEGGEDLELQPAVARVKLDDARRAEDLNDRLHFCVFENGASDSIYVGMRYGMWTEGSFDLEVDGKVVFTGRVAHLLYQGTVIPMGDVLEGPLNTTGPDTVDVRITRVDGVFK